MTTYTIDTGIPSDQHYVTDAEGRLYHRDVMHRDGEWVTEEGIGGDLALSESELLSVFGPCHPAEQGDGPPARPHKPAWMTTTLLGAW